MSAFCSAATRAAIGLDWLERAIAPAGEFGRAARAGELPFRCGDEAAARGAIERVDRLARAASADVLTSVRAAIGAAPDPLAAVTRASAGDVLADTDFFEVSRFLDAIEDVRSLASGDAFAGAPIPEQAGKVRAALSAGRTAQRTFYLSDTFDPALASARAVSREKHAAFDAARSRIASRVAALADIESVRDGEFVIMRDRLSGPMPPEIRVLRDAPTYFLCEVALDDAALAALAARDAADTDVARAEERVRGTISRSIGDELAAMVAAAKALGALDALVSRALFAQRYATVVPEIVDEPTVAFSDARYIPLDVALAEHARRYVPISLHLAGVGVLTGPNMGGKSAALRTCGFIAACVALGVPVPAASARVGLFDELVWIGMGAARDGEALLSAFGSEVVALREFFELAAMRPLVLIDEFARTTTPREGLALLVALLAILGERGACALAATHLSNVAEQSGAAHFAIGGLRELPQRGSAADLESALAAIAGAMDYSVHPVGGEAPERADAIALADVLGLDPGLIAQAREALQP